jgi:hypothetical protein
MGHLSDYRKRVPPNPQQARISFPRSDRGAGARHPGAPGPRGRLVRVEGHRFWPDSVSILEADRFDLAGAGAANLTDLYLLRLAAASKGRLVTFDRTIRWQQVTGCGPDDLEVLPGMHSPGHPA